MEENIKVKNESKNNLIEMLLSIFLISGIYGFIYEEIFYKFNDGYFSKRGTTFGPWIPIYAFGGIAIYLFLNKFNEKPLLVFLLSALLTGLIEFLTGFILLNFFGIRLWNYNTEILNFGNIDGFICLRSVLFFAISGIISIYVLVPFIKNIIEKHVILKKVLVIFSLLFIFDIFLSLILRIF